MALPQSWFSWWGSSLTHPGPCAPGFLPGNLISSQGELKPRENGATETTILLGEPSLGEPRRGAGQEAFRCLSFPKPSGRVLGYNLGTSSAHSKSAAEWLLAAVPALVLPNSSPGSGFGEKPSVLSGSPAIPGGAPGLAAMQLHPSSTAPASSNFLSASGSQAVTHSLHFLQGRLFPSWTNF